MRANGSFNSNNPHPLFLDPSFLTAESPSLLILLGSTLPTLVSHLTTLVPYSILSLFWMNHLSNLVFLSILLLSLSLSVNRFLSVSLSFFSQGTLSLAC
ncbi:hypothetical protein Scep_012624 [Stephania cephalantha]|uniref:Uncharacterized protein n=1 Tax=Stephania cephalantha TaxID=152367 RepID=A0AAP0JGS7_9MAGN